MNVAVTSCHVAKINKTCSACSGLLCRRTIGWWRAKGGHGVGRVEETVGGIWGKIEVLGEFDVAVVFLDDTGWVIHRSRKMETK